MDLYLKGKQRREDDDDKICITCMCNMHAVQQSIKKKGPRMSTATTTQSNRTTMCVCVCVCHQCQTRSLLLRWVGQRWLCRHRKQRSACLNEILTGHNNVSLLSESLLVCLLALPHDVHELCCDCGGLLWWWLMMILVVVRVNTMTHALLAGERSQQTEQPQTMRSVVDWGTSFRGWVFWHLGVRLIFCYLRCCSCFGHGDTPQPYGSTHAIRRWCWLQHHANFRPHECGQDRLDLRWQRPKEKVQLPMQLFHCASSALHDWHRLGSTGLESRRSWGTWWV